MNAVTTRAKTKHNASISSINTSAPVYGATRARTARQVIRK